MAHHQSPTCVGPTEGAKWQELGVTKAPFFWKMLGGWDVYSDFVFLGIFYSLLYGSIWSGSPEPVHEQRIWPSDISMSMSGVIFVKKVG